MSFSSCVGRHLDPVGRPEIDAENADVVGGEPVAQVRRVGEAGKAEERRMQLQLGKVGRLAGAEILAVGGPFHRDHALENIRPRARLAHVAQRRLGMGVGVVRDIVALLDLAPRQRRQRVDIAADDEEGRAHALRSASARSTCGVVRWSGPSSKVRITSWSASGMVLG